jgi:hypothetical protein
VPEIRMTLEEYEALLAASKEFEGTGKLPSPSAVKKMKPKPRRKGKAAKGMGQAMREANKRLRTKSGKLRKGKTQADVARLAHKIRRQKYA